ncbi:MAG: DUF3300 domain-containing protein [Acetobacteraceae bacterium]|nr:DUF3300 domain-containing protein [Acetobacteraceae bacterium]
MLRRWMIVLAALLVLPATWPSLPHAQQSSAAAASGPNANAGVAEADTFDPQQLDALLAPIALYPDTLLTQLLMATTFPLQVVEAARWVAEPAHKDLKGEPLTQALEKEKWDPSVKSLVPFPQVLAQLNQHLDWMQQVGYAFAQQQRDVFDSIQRLRRQAQSTGHLESSPQQVVRVEPATAAQPVAGEPVVVEPVTGQQTITPAAGQQTIIIEPAQPDTVYVPSYNPAVVYGTWPYPSYPPTYLPPPVGYPVGTALASGLAFGAGVALTAGLWGWASSNWNSGDVNVNVNRWNNINATGGQRINSNVWRANARPGGLPPNLRRAPAGPVGRPVRANGLPANAIGRQNVSVPANLVNRPARQAAGTARQATRPNLAPGSRPGGGQPARANRANVGQARAGASPGSRAGNRQLAENVPNVGQANRPNVGQRNRPDIGQGNRRNIGQANRGDIGQRNRPGLQGGQARARPAAFSGMSDGNHAAQFGQRGGQSRQLAGGGGGGFRQAGGGARAGGGGGFRQAGGGARGGGRGGR